jgi:hypothetical protein
MLSMKMMLLSMHRYFLCAFDIIFGVFVKEANIRSLIFELFFYHIEEVFRAPNLPTRGSKSHGWISDSLGCSVCID